MLGRTFSCCGVFSCCGKGHTLRMAAAAGDIDLVTILLVAGVNPNSADCDGETPLTWAAGAGHAEIVAFLLQRGARVNHQAKTGRTALHCAVEKDRGPIVALLRNAPEIDVTIKDKQGLTAWDLRHQVGEVPVVSLFMSQIVMPQADNASAHSLSSIERAAAMGVERDMRAVRDLIGYPVGV